MKKISLNQDWQFAKGTITMMELMMGDAGNIENIDSCMEKIFINFYKSIGVNLESKPLKVNNTLYNAILKITINPYWG